MAVLLPAVGRASVVYARDSTAQTAAAHQFCRHSSVEHVLHDIVCCLVLCQLDCSIRLPDKDCISSSHGGEQSELVLRALRTAMELAHLDNSLSKNDDQILL